MRNCSRCKTEVAIERHHIYPRRFRNSTSKQKWHITIDLCHDCHLRLERLLTQLEKHLGRLPDEVYAYLAHNF